MLNRIVLVGRMTRDPESKYTQSGVPVATFGIAVDRPSRNSETGEREADFINVVAWRKSAEFVTQYLAKGHLVGVDGRLQIRQWTAQDGSRRTAAEVVAESVQALDRAHGQDSGTGQTTPVGVGATYDPDADPFGDE